MFGPHRGRSWPRCRSKPVRRAIRGLTAGAAGWLLMSGNPLRSGTPEAVGTPLVRGCHLPIDPEDLHPRGWRRDPTRSRSEPARRRPRAGGQGLGQLVPDGLRAGVGVHGRHPQPVPGRPLPRRRVPHHQVPHQRVDPPPLEGGGELVPQHLRGRLPGQPGGPGRPDELQPHPLLPDGPGVPPHPLGQPLTVPAADG